MLRLQNFSVHRLICFSVFAALSLVPGALRADTTPPAGTGDANAPTRMAVIVTGYYFAKNKPGEPPADVSAPAAEDAIEKAVKLEGDLAAKYPKCHIHIASIEAPEVTYQNETAPPVPFIHLRVTYLGDPGCLAAK